VGFLAAVAEEWGAALEMLAEAAWARDSILLAGLAASLGRVLVQEQVALQEVKAASRKAQVQVLHRVVRHLQAASASHLGVVEGLAAAGAAQAIPAASSVQVAACQAAGQCPGVLASPVDQAVPSLADQVAAFPADQAALARQAAPPCRVASRAVASVVPESHLALTKAAQRELV
jgi:hypothetical protein